jgi:hypothetical protein
MVVRVTNLLWAVSVELPRQLLRLSRSFLDDAALNELSNRLTSYCESGHSTFWVEVETVSLHPKWCWVDFRIGHFWVAIVVIRECKGEKSSLGRYVTARPKAELQRLSYNSRVLQRGM